MRTLHLSVVTAALALCAAGLPRAGASAVPRNAKAKWTVMLYMNGDNNLDEWAVADFEELARVRYDPRVNVVVQLDRSDTGPGDNDSWGETRRFLMRQNLRPTRSDALPGFGGEANMGDPATLASFVSWARASYPAERYMLVIWSHGDGWRRRTDEESARGGARPPAAEERRRAVAEAEALLGAGQLTDSKLASMNLTLSSVETQFRTISEDATDGSDMLYVREIQDALEGLFKGGRGLDVVGFDACLMQMVETGYAMRNVAAVMVGSEELEPADGWRYDAWVQALADSPDLGAAAVGMLVVETYKAHYDGRRQDTTLSAVRLAGVNRLAAAVSALSKELMSSLDRDLAAVKRARLNCRVFAPQRGYHGVDLHHFSTQLAADTGVGPRLREKAREVASLVESTVLHNYAGGDRRAGFGARGLAIYFPADGASYRADKYGHAYTEANEEYPVRFVREQLWDDFLHAYFKRA